jgi:hypothetical protein
MKHYRVIRTPIPRSRLDYPDVRLLARKLRYKVSHPSFVCSPVIRDALTELRDVLNKLIDESECT